MDIADTIAGRSASLLPDLLGSLPGPVFAAAWKGDRLIIHLPVSARSARLRAKFADAMQPEGYYRFCLRFHRPAQFYAPPSLERLVATFAGDTLVYDPTGAIARAATLVGACRSVREAVDADLFGLYYAPLLRTFVVALEPHDDRVKLSALA